MGPMHDLGNGRVDAGGHHTVFQKSLYPALGDISGGPSHRSLLFGKVKERGLGQFPGNFSRLLALGDDAHTGCHCPELGFVSDGIIGGSALGGFKQGMSQVFGMTGMRRGTRGYGARQIAGYNGVCRSTASS
jgi:hypothetical protein